MFKSSVFAHNLTVSRKMFAKGLYRKLSETDRAGALSCIDAGMQSREVARRFRTNHQTINRIVQRYRHNGQFKNLTRSGRPRVTARAEDRYVTNVVAKQKSLCDWTRSSKPTLCYQGSRSPPCLCKISQKPYPCWWL